MALSGQVVTALAPGARAAVFVDNDDSGFDGTPIATNVPITSDAKGNWTAQANWDLSGLLPLPYHLYALIDDGVNPPSIPITRRPSSPSRR